MSQFYVEGMPLPHSKQLLNRIVDYIAVAKPRTLFAEYPISPLSYEAGLRKITYSTLAKAIDSIAWWLHDTLGPGKDFETLAYIGPNNFFYPALILGAVKAGYKTLLLSPRNSSVAQLHLLAVTKCKVFLTPSPYPPAVATILALENHGLRVLETPTVADLLQASSRPFPYKKSFEDGCDDPLTVIHTSGSTGLPKPMTWTLGFCATYASSLNLDPPPGFNSVDKLWEGNRAFITFPPFHAAYIANVLVNAINNQTSFIFPLEAAIPSAKLLSEALKHTSVDIAMVVPSILEEMSRSPDLLNYISARLDTLIYSGGDLPRACGDVIASKIQLVNFYGSTEAASPPLICPGGDWVKEDWKYLSIHPDAGAEFRHFAADMYELSIVRHPQLEKHQQIFKQFPDLQEFLTKDLFRSHPSKSGLWNHCGRADDIIVFSTGEKMNPITMEQYIFSSHSEIAGVLVAGSQRFQAALLIELAEKKENNSSDTTLILEKIWPTIMRANEDIPAHARIAKSHVLFTDLERPMMRTPKRTIQRQATISLYAKDLDNLYENADGFPTSGNVDSRIDCQDIDGLVLHLRKIVTGITGKSFTDEENFFVQGMDSLQALLLTRNLRQTIAIPDLNTSTIYENPTVLLLAQALQQYSMNQQTSMPLEGGPRYEAMNTMLKEYIGLIERIPIPVAQKRASKSADVVLLTGSTGAVGSYLLDLLMASSVAHVYCLNRASNSMETQKKRNRSRGLSTEFPSSRITFLTADLSKPYLGLGPKVYSILLEQVTKIIHNAWQVNFNIPLSSFRPQLAGVVNLISFAASAVLCPSLLYISSISAASNHSTLTVPEEVVPDPSTPSTMGYGQSKYLSEHILDHAAQRLANVVRIARVGQIAGTTQGLGKWNKSEWLPSLIVSSRYVGFIPESIGHILDNVDWIPIDALARVVLDLVNDAHSCSENADLNGTLPGRAHVFNLLNLHPVQWQDLLPSIMDELSSLRQRDAETAMQKVDMESWIRKVQDFFETRKVHSHAEAVDMELLLESNPSIKLLPFFDQQAKTRSKLSWETRRAEEGSETLRALEGIKEEWVRNWVRGWFADDASPV